MQKVLFLLLAFAFLRAAADKKPKGRRHDNTYVAAKQYRKRFLSLIRERKSRRLFDLQSFIQGRFKIPFLFDCNDDDEIAPTLQPTATTPSTVPTSATPSPSRTLTPDPPVTPTPQPSSSPTPPLVTNSTIKFDGIAFAYSSERGKIKLTWDGLLLNDYNVFFDVFVALGDYDYNATLANKTIDELIDTFQNQESTFEHYNFANVDSATISSIYFGNTLTLLVTAKVGDIYSSNTASRSIVLAESDPKVKDDINVVGMFVPTLNWMIEIDDDAPEGIQHSLNFSGLVSPYARNLTVGDYITGITSQLQPFVRCVVAVVRSSPELVVLTVVHADIGEIFAELDLDVGFEPAVSVGSASSGRNFFSDLGGMILDGVEAIGDAVIGVVEDVKDTIIDVANLITGGEVLEEFNLVDIQESWMKEITGQDNRTGAKATLTAEGAANFKTGLFARVRISPTRIFNEVGAKAEFSAEFSLKATAGVGTEYKQEFEIWKGKTMRRVIAIGVVPVQFYATPKLELMISAGASLKLNTSMGASAKGGTKVSAIYDTSNSPNFYPDFQPPYIETDYTLPRLDGELAVTAGIDLVLNLDAGLYEGLVKANIAAKAGVGFDAGASLAVIGDGVIIPELRRFDLSFSFTIPFSASALYDEIEIAKIDLFTKSWPILGLPAIDIVIMKEHRCVLMQGGGALASLGLRATEDYSREAFIFNSVTDDSSWFLTDESDGWSIIEQRRNELNLAKNEISSFSQPPEGTVTIVMQPQIPPLPLKIVKSVSLEKLLTDAESVGVACLEAGPCDGSDYFDRLSQEVGTEFNSDIFLSQPPDPALPPVPSTVYKFEDFMTALTKLQSAGSSFQFWLGDDCSVDSQKIGLVNMAAFLGQSMRETIIYDACDENNWDLWRADIPKEPTSPPEILPALYPMSSGCGQLGQKYAEYSCDDECPQDLTMELTATTNAGWIGAPPPLFCGPKSTYDGLGYWNPHRFCQGEENTCVGEPFYYEGQTAGIHVPVSEDDRFPEFFYTNPLPGNDGTTPEPRSPDDFPSTNVEGCCWWGRGVIQTTGRCNFGRLNKQVGSGAGGSALYPDINFCTNPQAVCTGPLDLKWIAGIAFWVSESGPQVYDREGYNFKEGVAQFVEMGCAESIAAEIDRPECDVLFEYASGIVNRGCHDPGETGCPECIQGATCDPAHNVPERVAASKQALRALMQTVNEAGR